MVNGQDLWKHHDEPAVFLCRKKGSWIAGTGKDRMGRRDISFGFLSFYPRHTSYMSSPFLFCFMGWEGEVDVIVRCARGSFILNRYATPLPLHVAARLSSIFSSFCPATGVEVDTSGA